MWSPGVGAATPGDPRGPWGVWPYCLEGHPQGRMLKPEDPLSSRAASRRPRGPAECHEDQRRALSGDPNRVSAMKSLAWKASLRPGGPCQPPPQLVPEAAALPGLQTRLPASFPVTEPRDQLAVPTHGCCWVGQAFVPDRPQPLRTSGCPSIPDGQAEAWGMSPGLACPTAAPLVVLGLHSLRHAAWALRQKEGTLWAWEEAGRVPVFRPGWARVGGLVERTGAWCPSCPTHLPAQGQEKPEARGVGGSGGLPEDGGPPETKP